jgi:hypothetical protein
LDLFPRCTWKGCAATFPANQRTEHRRKHINAAGVICYTVPGNYKYKVETGVTQLQIQLWGGGGGGGGLKHQIAGSGGGGAFVEALVKVREGEVLEITVGSGGSAGCLGTETLTEDPNDPSATHVEEIIGQAMGGFPGITCNLDIYYICTYKCVFLSSFILLVSICIKLFLYFVV